MLENNVHFYCDLDTSLLDRDVGHEVVTVWAIVRVPMTLANINRPVSPVCHTASY